MKLSDRTDINKIEQFITFSDAAIILGTSRQNVHVMASNGKFSSLSRIGESQPLFVLDRGEVQRIAEVAAQRRSRTTDSELTTVKSEQ